MGKNQNNEKYNGQKFHFMILFVKTDYHFSSQPSTIDYYPFGQEMPGRVYSPTSYRYGFNGKENDNEVAGTGNWQNYGMREYDARVCRFISVDPLTKKYPELTPFQFASNTPIMGIDLDGTELLPINSAWYHMKYLKNTPLITTEGPKPYYQTVLTPNVPSNIVINDMPGVYGKDYPRPENGTISATTNEGMPSGDDRSRAPFLMKPKGANPFYAEHLSNNNNSSKLAKGMTAVQGIMEIANIVGGWNKLITKDLPKIEMSAKEGGQRNPYYNATKIVDNYMKTYKNESRIDNQFKTPQARTDFINYILDGALPENGSKEYNDGIVKYGKGILIEQMLPVRENKNIIK